MDKTTELYNLVFDKLVNNTSYPQFEPEMADNMCLVYDKNTGKGECIELEIGDTKYTITITPTHKAKE